MATLSGNKIKDTYQSLVKFSDNGNITTSAKQLTDGFGNNSPMFVSTTQVGIGVTPESGLNLHVFGDAKIGSNLTVIGNLVVEGSTTTVGTDTLTVKDPLIVLANNNTSTDAVDIGFYGKYTPSGTTLYSGLFREALTGKYRLFKGLEDEPTTTVNTSGTGYAQATLIAALEGNVTGNITGNVTGNLIGNVTGNVTGDLTGDVTGDVTGDLTGNVTGGTISGTTGTFSGNVDIDGTLDVDDVISVEGSAFGRIEIGGASGGYVDLKAPNSDDYDLRLITSVGGAELLSIDTLKFYTGATTDLAFTIDASQNATFENNVTIPETPTADTHAASKGYVDAAVEGQDTLAEILANGNTTGGTDIAVSANDDITFADDSKIILGDGSDVEMYWDGFFFQIDSSLVQGGTRFVTNNLVLVSSQTIFDLNQAVQKYYSGGNEKFRIYSDGVKVYGNIESNNGTASSPAYAFDADGDIGMYRSGADELSFSTSGTQRLVIDSSGNIGINTSTPSDYTADELVISVPDDSGMTLVSGTTDTAYIRFADGTAAADQANFISHDHNTNTLTVFSQAKVSIGILEAEVAYFTDTNFYVDKSTTIDDNLFVDGNVGIGDDTPTSKLTVLGTSTAASNTPSDAIVDIQGTSTAHLLMGVANVSPYGAWINTDSTAQPLVLMGTGGNVGIGTDSPDAKLDVNGATYVRNVIYGYAGAGNQYGGLSWNSTDDGFLFLKSANVTKVNINSNGNSYLNGGNVGIGTTSPTVNKLQVEGSTDGLGIAIKNTGTGGRTYGIQSTGGTSGYGQGKLAFVDEAVGARMLIESDGGIFFPALGGFSVSNSDVRYNATSDELYYQTSSKRYKSEITDLENSLDKVNNLRPVRFKDNLSQEYATGMIAEEVAEIIPEVVFTKPIDGFDEPQIEGINYSDIVPFLIKSIQELKAEIDILKTQIN